MDNLDDVFQKRINKHFKKLKRLRKRVNRLMKLEMLLNKLKGKN